MYDVKIGIDDQSRRRVVGQQESLGFLTEIGDGAGRGNPRRRGVRLPQLARG
jgi:hypothetical protein